MKDLFKQALTQAANPRQKGWALAKSLRDGARHPITAAEQALADAYIAGSLNAETYRQHIHELTDWAQVSSSADYGGIDLAEREYRADIIATMEITVTQGEAGRVR